MRRPSTGLGFTAGSLGAGLSHKIGFEKELLQTQKCLFRAMRGRGLGKQSELIEKLKLKTIIIVSHTAVITGNNMRCKGEQYGRI